MIDYGNAFASMVDKSCDALGAAAAFESLVCFVASLVHFYLVTPIVALSNLRQPEEVPFNIF
jgi:hypothetical protein